MIRDNVIECEGQTRPLLRNKESYTAVIVNNQLTNISDTDSYANPGAKEQRGVVQPLKFDSRAHGEFKVDEWRAARTK